MQLNGQQWILKDITINGAHVGIAAGGFNLVCLQCNLQNGAVGIDASGVSGSITVIDSSGLSLGTFISSSSPGGTAGNSIILDNISVDNSGATVTLNGQSVFEGSIADTWVSGNLVSASAMRHAMPGGSRFPGWC